MRIYSLENLTLTGQEKQDKQQVTFLTNESKQKTNGGNRQELFRVKKQSRGCGEGHDYVHPERAGHKIRSFNSRMLLLRYRDIFAISVGKVSVCSPLGKVTADAYAYFCYYVSYQP